jgi:hypothetical protein
LLIFFQVRISDLELYENPLWETIATIDICGVRKSERNIFNKLSRNLSHLSITEFCEKSNGFYQLIIVYMRLKNGNKEPTLDVTTALVQEIEEESIPLCWLVYVFHKKANR